MEFLATVVAYGRLETAKTSGRSIGSGVFTWLVVSPSAGEGGTIRINHLEGLFPIPHKLCPSGADV